MSLTIALIVLAVLVALAVVIFGSAWAIGFVSISENEVGLVTKKFGKSLPDGHIIALNGEAGDQVDTLSPGWKFGYFPWKYSITKVAMIDVPKDQIALVEAIDGVPVNPGRRFGDVTECDNFQDGRKFLTSGGARGQQMNVLMPGRYRINTKLFNVITSANCKAHGIQPDGLTVTRIDAKHLGVVTVSDGKTLGIGEFAAPIVSGHSGFTDPQAFINAGGYRGLQQEILPSGDFVINPWFATLKLTGLVEVPPATVGIVISSVGETGVDTSGEAFTHGEIVPVGHKGIWETPLNPGLHAINPDTHEVHLVQTSKIALNWVDNVTSEHALDSALGTIRVTTRDGFTIPIEVQQVINIPYKAASRIIAQFGSVSVLVTSMLDEMVCNYFRNSVQQLDAKEFLDSRAQIQSDAEGYIRAELAKFDINGVSTFICGITPPGALMQILQERQLAAEGIETAKQQQLFEESKQALGQASALANMQNDIVTAQQQVTISKSRAEAAAAMAEGQKRVKVTEAQGEAEANAAKADGIRKLADATAHKIQVEGEAEAEIISKKVAAVGMDSYRAIEVATKLSNGNLKLVPDIALGSPNGSSNVVEGLLATMLADKFQKTETP